MPSIIAFRDRHSLFTATGTNASTYRSDLLRKQGAAAFGTPEPVLQGRALGLDAVAMLIRDDLARAIPRKLAADIVRGYFDQWAEAVSRIEHQAEEIVFVVAELGEDDWRAAFGPAAKLGEYIGQLPNTLRRVVVVQIADLLKGIRERAAAAGLDLAGAYFFVPPDHPLLVQCRSEWQRWRRENVRPGKIGRSPPLDRVRRREIEGLIQ